jgi:hypothetical protein
MMREAYDYAMSLQRPGWDFAVEIAVLRGYGLSHSDLRWLVCQGIIEHGAEVDAPKEDSRTFIETGSLTFKKRTCFVLTAFGAEITRTLHGPSALDNVRVQNLLPSPSASIVPEWDNDRLQLRVNGELVKQFKLPAPNQELILAAFQEEGWPPRIDDPLPPHVEQNSKRRLRDTIIAQSLPKAPLDSFHRRWAR